MKFVQIKMNIEIKFRYLFRIAYTHRKKFMLLLKGSIDYYFIEQMKQNE